MGFTKKATLVYITRRFHFFLYLCEPIRFLHTSCKTDDLPTDDQEFTVSTRQLHTGGAGLEK